MKELINCGAGPSKLPKEVIYQLEKSLSAFSNSGIGILETSHRSNEFKAVLKKSQDLLKTLLNIPIGYSILFMPGGGSMQFEALILNLFHKSKSKSSIGYIISGKWSQKAFDAAENLNTCNIAKVKYEEVLNPDSNEFLQRSQFIYFCDNETIDGIEMPGSDFLASTILKQNPDAKIICDMSSNILSRPVDVSKYSIIFASTQKNIGASGMAIVILKDTLIEKSGGIPRIMDYNIYKENESLYNTPSTFTILSCFFMFEWLFKHFDGSLDRICAYNSKKSALLYDIIDQSKGFYFCTAPSAYRSRMNIVFRIKESEKYSAVLESKFINLAEAQGILQINGHRSIGGIRISLYNSITLFESQIIGEFMKKFYTDFT